MDSKRGKPIRITILLLICMSVFLNFSLPVFGGNTCAIQPQNENYPVCIMSGRVIDSIDEKPVAGAEIFQKNCGGVYNSAVTDSSGRYSIGISATGRNQGVYIIAPGYISRRNWISIGEQEKEKSLDFVLSPSSGLKGIIKDANGVPIKGAKVKTFHFTNHPVITDETGQYEIDGLDPMFGQYSVHVTHPDYPSACKVFIGYFASPDLFGFSRNPIYGAQRAAS